jgi:aminoglycoside 6'-N-acetyltransferase I
VRIVDLRPRDRALVRQVARLLVDGFREQEPEAFPDMRTALAEVRRSFGSGRLSRVAVEPPGTALGWIGGLRLYRGRTWELHPLVVRRDRQRQGIGRALVRDFERRLARRAATTIFLGTDDVDGRTSVAGIDLYPDVLGHARRIRNLRGHSYEFYQRPGFAVIGVLPDANGRGRPDIFMAKRVVG